MQQQRPHQQPVAGQRIHGHLAGPLAPSNQASFIEHALAMRPGTNRSRIEPALLPPVTPGSQELRLLKKALMVRRPGNSR